MRILPGIGARSYTIFLSSSDELADVRKTVFKLVYTVIAPVLGQLKTGINVELDRYEDTAPQVAEGTTVNRDFVGRAINSHLALVLLRDRLGEGTEEEFRELMSQPAELRPQVSLIWFEPRVGADPNEVAKIKNLIDEFSDTIFYVPPKKAGKPGSERAYRHLFRVLFDFAASILMQRRTSPEYLTEVRGGAVE